MGSWVLIRLGMAFATVLASALLIELSKIVKQVIKKSKAIKVREEVRAR